MSEGITGIFTRFIQKMQLRREIKLDKIVEALDRNNESYNITLKEIHEKFDIRTTGLTQFGSVLSVVGYCLSVVSAILTAFGIILS